jgi:hypothetical protein
MTLLAALVLTCSAADAAPPPVAGRDQAAQVVEYLVEIYESPTSAPPPEVAGPQGRRLFIGTLRAPLGAEAREYVPAGEPAANDASKMRGISIALSSARAGTGLRTTMVVDTNLPFGTYDQKQQTVWVHAQTVFTTASGATQYVLEPVLTRTATASAAPPPASSGPGIAGRVAETVVAAGQSAASAHVPGASHVPPLGGIVRGGGGGGSAAPKPRPTILVFAITPLLGGSAQ